MKPVAAILNAADGETGQQNPETILNVKAARRAALRERIPLWVFVFSFAFDYRGNISSGEGSGLQKVFVAAAVAAALRYMMFPRAERPPKALVLLTCAWFAFLFLAVVSPTNLISHEGQDWLKAIVASMPSLLLGLALLVSQTMIARRTPFSVLRIPILLACFTNTLVQARYGLVESGLDVETVRYQVMGQGALFIWGLAFLEMVPLFRPKLLTFLSLAAAAISAVISINRGVLLGVGGAFLLVLLVCGRYRKQISGANLANLARGCVILTLVAVLVSVTAVAIRPNVWHSWTLRLSRLGSGAPVGEDTVGIRVAASEMEFRAIGQEPVSLFFGLGFSAEPAVVGSPNRFMFAKNIYLNHLGIWDVLWPYPFYVAGLVGGSLAIWVLLGGYLRAVRTALNSPVANSDRLWSNLAPAFMLTVVIASSVSGNFLTTRFACILIGLAIGNAFALPHRLEGATPKKEGDDFAAV